MNLLSVEDDAAARASSTQLLRARVSGMSGIVDANVPRARPMTNARGVARRVASFAAARVAPARAPGASTTRSSSRALVVVAPRNNAVVDVDVAARAHRARPRAAVVASMATPGIASGFASVPALDRARARVGFASSASSRARPRRPPSAPAVVAGDGDGAVDEDATNERIIDTELSVEASQSYLAYAMSVIVGRALPDVRDGLKPVHRRILYAMHELGLDSKKPFKKCARVVGEVLGKFHPHGDQSVYDALVRMAQDFSMSAQLVDGHGNFGSLDADPPAAMRYTECRLRSVAEAMLLADIDADAVDFTETFDGSQNEPSVLPARLPNILINGSTGIAVGMATSIPPHNLREVADALAVYAADPDGCTLDDLLKVMPAPDFPTSGIIMAPKEGKGFRDMYATGKGSVTLRGAAHIEEIKTSVRGKNATTKNAVIITSIPYQARSIHWSPYDRVGVVNAVP